VCCSVLQCVAVSCSVLQCIGETALKKWKPPTVRCSVLQCVAVCCSELQCVGGFHVCTAACCSVFQCVTVCSKHRNRQVRLVVYNSVLQCVAMDWRFPCLCYNMLQYVAVCCGALITWKSPTASPITSWANQEYGVATISRLLKILGLFCRISSLL